MATQRTTSVWLKSHRHDAGKVDLYHLTGGSYVLERLTSELRIHGVDLKRDNIQAELESSLAGLGKRRDQLITWAFIEPPSSYSVGMRGYEKLWKESREDATVYKASFTLDSNEMRPITARLFTPHFLFTCLERTPYIQPLLEFFQQYLIEAVMSERHCPFIVLFIYTVSNQPKEPLPSLRQCGSDIGLFLEEIGLSQYCHVVRKYRWYKKDLWRMSQSEVEEMFLQCQFTIGDRAHFTGIWMEYSNKIIY